MREIAKGRSTASAAVARPGERIEHPVAVELLIERLLAAQPQCGVALLDDGLAVAGARIREALVGIGVARRAVAIRVALIVDGEGLRNRRGQQRQAERGSQNGQAMTRCRMLHGDLTLARSGKPTSTIWPQGGECKFPPPLRARGTAQAKRALPLRSSLAGGRTHKRADVLVPLRVERGIGTRAQPHHFAGVIFVGIEIPGSRLDFDRSDFVLPALFAETGLIAVDRGRQAL